MQLKVVQEFNELNQFQLVLVVFINSELMVVYDNRVSCLTIKLESLVNKYIQYTRSMMLHSFYF